MAMRLNDMAAKILAVFPNATWAEDNEGQLVIYTDMQAIWDEERGEMMLNDYHDPMERI